MLGMVIVKVMKRPPSPYPKGINIIKCVWISHASEEFFV